LRRHASCREGPSCPVNANGPRESSGAFSRWRLLGLVWVFYVSHDRPGFDDDADHASGASASGASGAAWGSGRA
jgi:hypothetical protein